MAPPLSIEWHQVFLWWRKAISLPDPTRVLLSGCCLLSPGGHLEVWVQMLVPCLVSFWMIIPRLIPGCLHSIVFAAVV